MESVLIDLSVSLPREYSLRIFQVDSTSCNQKRMNMTALKTRNEMMFVSLNMSISLIRA